MSHPDVKWGGLTFVWCDDSYFAALGTGIVELFSCDGGWAVRVATGADNIPVECAGPDEVTALKAAFQAAETRHEDALRRIREVLREVGE